jgi:hypothetical protein
MGTSYGYTCKACGRTNEISGKGWQCGMTSAIVAVSCADCHKVSDVEVTIDDYFGDREVPPCPNCGSSPEVWDGGDLVCTCGEVMDVAWTLLWD